MEKLAKISLVISLIGFMGLSGVCGIPTYYLMDYCGSSTIKSVYTSTDMRLKLSRSDYLTGNIRCSLTVYSDYMDIDRILGRFRSIFFSVNSNYNCHIASLKIFDGSTTDPTHAITGPNGLCTSVLSSKEYVSNTTALTFLFMMKQTSVFDKANFDLLLSAFHYGTCWNYEFQCDNNRCIDSSLKCNGYNDCGDNSDENGTACELAQWAIGVISASVCVFFICLAALIYCRMVRSRRYTRIVTRTTYPPAGNPGYIPPPAGNQMEYPGIKPDGVNYGGVN